MSTSGSALEFDNTYGASCTAQFIACIVAAEDQLESLFTTFNSKTDKIAVTFNEQNSGQNGVALGNSSHGILTNYSTLKSALQSAAPSDVLPSTDPSGGARVVRSLLVCDDAGAEHHGGLKRPQRHAEHRL